MLVKDEAVQARHTRQTAHENYADQVNAATMAELGRARIMEDGDLAPNNPARQMGRLLTPRELDGLIAQFGIPNLLIEPHPTNRGKRCIYQIRDGAKTLICVYENNVMPEMSIVEGVVKWIPDPDYIGGGRVVTRADLGESAGVTNAEAAVLVDKHGFTGALGELQKRAEDREPSRIGMKRVVTPGAEKVRGWRTVLVYLMQHGLISPEQIRSVVTGPDRASWKGYLDGDKAALGEWLR